MNTNANAANGAKISVKYCYINSKEGPSFNEVIEKSFYTFIKNEMAKNDNS